MKQLIKDILFSIRIYKAIKGKYNKELSNNDMIDLDSFYKRYYPSKAIKN
jgi:hypothetical protein